MFFSCPTIFDSEICKHTPIIVEIVFLILILSYVMKQNVVYGQIEFCITKTFEIQ